MGFQLIGLHRIVGRCTLCYKLFINWPASHSGSLGSCTLCIPSTSRLDSIGRAGLTGSAKKFPCPSAEYRPWSAGFAYSAALLPIKVMRAGLEAPSVS